MDLCRHRWICADIDGCTQADSLRIWFPCTCTQILLPLKLPVSAGSTCQVSYSRSTVADSAHANISPCVTTCEQAFPFAWVQSTQKSQNLKSAHQPAPSVPLAEKTHLRLRWRTLPHGRTPATESGIHIYGYRRRYVFIYIHTHTHIQAQSHPCNGVRHIYIHVYRKYVYIYI